VADESPRLLDEVPTLDSLRVSVEESGDGSFLTASKYTRLFVLHNAPAYFWIPCGNPRCESGGHDLTREIMHALRARAERAEGQHDCPGSSGNGYCTTVIRYRVDAAYRPE